ncbi:hypothetical protein [Paenibacillus rigui]|uniref:Uncharacterized protein n=1 Tax=Paenibacillus rigui TaxID=554312 RepID=A0A229UK99_9BACL|nr:hypothetical protein [Paenibacillus rigui]OXM83878.1 hypothetical protein CF651_23490 [Paenibacillus rigui]
MKQQWVDCYIDKLLAIYPQIQSYTAMIDRWAFIPEWTATEVDFNLKRVLETEQRLFELYGIRRQFNSGWIDEALQSGLRVLLPCDLYYMPHAKVFYGVEHAGHYIWVQKLMPDGSYQIFDDHPAFNGVMAGDALRQAHEAMKLPYQALEPECERISDEQAVQYIARMLQSDSFHLGRFANQLLNTDLSPNRKCEILKGTRHMQHRLNGLLRIMDHAPLPVSGMEDMTMTRQSVTNYIDGWRATVNLALKGMLVPVETVWDRLEQRLHKHAEGDRVLTEAAAQIVGNLELASDGGRTRS